MVVFAIGILCNIAMANASGKIKIHYKNPLIDNMFANIITDFGYLSKKT